MQPGSQNEIDGGATPPEPTNPPTPPDQNLFPQAGGGPVVSAPEPMAAPVTPVEPVATPELAPEPISPAVEATEAAPIVAASPALEPVAPTPEPMAPVEPAAAPSPFGSTAQPEAATFSDTPEPAKASFLGNLSQKVKIAIILAVVAVLGIGGGVAALLINNSDQKIVLDALTNLTSSDEVALTGPITWSDSDSKTEVQLTLNALTVGADSQSSVALDIKSDEAQYKVSGEAIFSQGDLYIKADYADILGALGADNTKELSSYNNRWIKISKELLDRMLEGQGLKYSEVQKCSTEALQNFKASKKQQKELYGAIYQSGVMSFEKTGTANGVHTYDLRLASESKKYRDAITGARDSEIFQALLKCSGVEQEINRDLDDEVSYIDDNTTVHQSDLPTISFSIDSKTRQFTNLSVKYGVLGGRFDLNLSSQVTKRTNKTVSVPADYVDLEEIMQLLGGFWTPEPVPFCGSEDAVAGSDC